MLTAATFSLLAAGSAFAGIIGPVIEFDPATASDFEFGGDLTAGWSFTTNSAITVTALDAFDPTGTGLVRLYDASGNILASAHLSTSDPVEGSPTPFYTQSVAPVLLSAGTTYFIVEDMCGIAGSSSCASPGTTAYGTDFNGGPILTVDPAINYIGEIGAGGLGELPISDGFGGAYNPAFFGPNFDYSSTPEPSTFAMGLGALIGLGSLFRRRLAR